MASVIILSSLLSIAAAQSYNDAYFISIKVTNGTGTIELLDGGEAKVYHGQKVSLNLTYYNFKCGSSGGILYTKVYRNDVLFANSSEAFLQRYWTTTNQLNVYEYGPMSLNYGVELWWNNSATLYLEDVHNFTIQVVRLSVANWSPQSISLEKGKTTASTWTASFQNGGNDVMFGVSISVIDSGSLQVSPTSISLGDLEAQETKAVNLSLIAPPGATSGSHSLSFRISYSDFRGTSHSEIESASVDIIRLQTSLNLSLEPSSLKIGESTAVTATLKDGNGLALANRDITFYIGTTAIGTATTDSSGNATKSFTVNVDPGTYPVKAYYAGNPDYSSSSATSNLLVNPSETSLTISIGSVKVGETTTIAATLKDEKGNPISGATIDLYLYDDGLWTKINATTTDAAGKASIARTFNWVGNYTIKANYQGTASYKASQATSTTTVDKYTTTLTAQIPSTTQGKEVTLKATLKDENGNPVKNSDVDFYIYKENAWQRIGTGKTDSSGVASLIHIPLASGTWPIKIAFGGSPNYTESSKTASLDVAMDYSMYYILGGLVGVVLLGILVYAVAHNRTRAKPTQQTPIGTTSEEKKKDDSH